MELLCNPLFWHIQSSWIVRLTLSHNRSPLGNLMMVTKIMKYDKEMAEIFEDGTFNTEIINHQFSKSL